MEQKLLFIGYKSFTSKNGDDFYILSFLSEPVVSVDGKKAYCTDVDIFCDITKYNSFIKSNKLMDYVSIPFEIVGNRVKYNI